MKHGTGGYRKGCRCITCSEGHKAYMRSYNDSEKKRGKNRRWAKKDRNTRPEFYKASKHEYAMSGKKEADRLLREYGLTVAQRDAMIAAQGNRCKICRELFDLNARGVLRPHIDHMHGTKVVRGMLCKECNLGIGLLQDDPKVIRQAADYVETKGQFDRYTETVDEHY